MDIPTFTSQFNFRPELRGYIGVERECFVTRKGVCIPVTDILLKHLPKSGEYGYELSACQLEMRTPPTARNNVMNCLWEQQNVANYLALMLDLHLLHVPVAPENMVLDVYSDPTGRYAEISRKLPRDVLSAACRVAATHIHIGTSGPDDAIYLYQKLVERFEHLKSIGNLSKGERLRLYELMSPTSRPQPYAHWNEYYAAMKERDLLQDPRQCWDMIRISKHGTVEVRVFDATSDINQIIFWIDEILK